MKSSSSIPIVFLFAICLLQSDGFHVPALQRHVNYGTCCDPRLSADETHTIGSKYDTGLHAEIHRRDFHSGLLSGILGGISLGKANPAAAAAIAGTKTKALADVPMVRLRLPNGGFGREYVALKLKVQDQGPFDFMVDSGLTLELITPHLQKILGIQEGNNRISGLGAGGSTLSSSLVTLKDASIVGNGMPDLALPPLTASITSFPQEHIDPNHDPVEGMLGMEVPGTADVSGLVEIPAVVINESLLVGIRVSTPEGNVQPILGFLDCGSSFSCINWKAAEALGLPPKNDPSYRNGASVSALGVDGRPLTLPTVKKQLSFVGNPIVDAKSGRPTGFEPPPSGWKPWNPVQLAVGDIPVFSQILGDGRTPYEGPAALIGLDILAQRRLVLEAGTGNSRVRKVAVSPN